MLLLMLSLPASAAGPKRIFITKYDENFNGMANVTFELYEDTDGDGVRDPGEPLLQTKVTDAAGSATFDPVNPGKYVVHEVTPAGYVDKPDQAVEIPNAKGKGPTVIFSNERKPANTGVNDSTGDTSVHDGTHVFDFGPAVAVACEELQAQRPALPGDPCPDPEILVAYNHSAGFGTAGGVSGVETKFSDDGGETWTHELKVQPGSGSVVLLGDPSVIFDPVHDRWVVASDAITNFGTVRRPIMVSTWAGPGSQWSTPVALPGAPASPAVSHGADLVFDPLGQAIHLLFTQSNADGTSVPQVSTSIDGGSNWSPPIPIAGPGRHFDFVDGVMGPDGRLHAAFAEFNGPDLFDVFHTSSTDPPTTWEELTQVAAALERSGTVGGCSGFPSGHSLFGSIVPFDAPSIAVDPSDRDVIYASFTTHGAGADESDVVVSMSKNGGLTWSTPLPIRSGDGRLEFAPLITVTPDGRISTAYLSADAAGTSFDLDAAFSDTFKSPEQLFVEGVLFIPVMQDSPFWQTDPSFDTHFSDCFGLPPIGGAAPGSGFVFAWADGRDPGPAGNGGVDPNIYAATTEGPALPTTLSAAVDTTSTKVKVTGFVKPGPIPGAKVTVTLFVDEGSGFDKVGRKRPITDEANGKWVTSFARPADGRCQVVVEFLGAVGREPSVPVTKTFAC